MTCKLVRVTFYQYSTHISLFLSMSTRFPSKYRNVPAQGCSFRYTAIITKRSALCKDVLHADRFVASKQAETLLFFIFLSINSDPFDDCLHAHHLRLTSVWPLNDTDPQNASKDKTSHFLHHETLKTSSLSYLFTNLLTGYTNLVLFSRQLFLRLCAILQHKAFPACALKQPVPCKTSAVTVTVIKCLRHHSFQSTNVPKNFQHLPHRLARGIKRAMHYCLFALFCTNFRRHWLPLLTEGA